MPAKPTFRQLVALEPELAGLLARAMEFGRRHKRDKKRDKWEAITRKWFGRGGDADDLGLNGDLLCWVGPLCKGGDPVLCTIEAYQVVSDTLTRVLEDR